MKKKSRRFSSQNGESQMGLLIGALVIGGLIAAVTSLQSCIYETKEARKTRVQQGTWEANNPQQDGGPARSYKGYQVTY